MKNSLIYIILIAGLVSSCSIFDFTDNTAEFVIENKLDSLDADYIIEHNDIQIEKFTLIPDDSFKFEINLGDDTISSIVIYTISSFSDTHEITVEKDHRYVYQTWGYNTYHLSIKHPD